MPSPDQAPMVDPGQRRFTLHLRILAALSLLAHAGQRFFLDGCGTMCASLSYTTLFAAVPLLVVSFAVLNHLPVLAGLRQTVDDFLFLELLPSLGPGLSEALHGFLHNATGLGFVGYLLLSVTVLLFWVEIDLALHRIWGGMHFHRRVGNVLVLGLITLGSPILVAITLGSLSYLLSLPALAGFDGLQRLDHLLLLVLPFAANLLGLFLIYWRLPQQPVRMRHAFMGALVAAVLFELARAGFGWYAQHAWLQARVYGAFAALPLLLIWVYTCWALVLYGAQVTHLQSVAPRVQSKGAAAEASK